MRFLLKFMLLVGVHKELDFFALYDEGFLLIRCNSLEAAFAYMKGAAPIDAVLLEADHDPQQAIEYCKEIRRCKPGVKIVLLSNPEVALPQNISADLVVDSSVDEAQLATQLVLALVPSDARDDWSAAGSGSPGCADRLSSVGF